jgi:hypothetical protein
MKRDFPEKGWLPSHTELFEKIKYIEKAIFYYQLKAHHKTKEYPTTDFKVIPEHYGWDLMFFVFDHEYNDEYDLNNKGKLSHETIERYEDSIKIWNFEYKSHIFEWGNQIDAFIRQVKKRMRYHNHSGISIILSFDKRFLKYEDILDRAGIQLLILPKELWDNPKEHVKGLVDLERKKIEDKEKNRIEEEERRERENKERVKERKDKWEKKLNVIKSLFKSYIPFAMVFILILILMSITLKDEISYVKYYNDVDIGDSFLEFTTDKPEGFVSEWVDGNSSVYLVQLETETDYDKGLIVIFPHGNLQKDEEGKMYNSNPSIEKIELNLGYFSLSK